MEGIRMPQWALPAINQLAAVAALHLGSREAAKRWIAMRSLQQDCKAQANTTSKVESGEEKAAVSSRHKSTWRSHLPYLISMMVHIAIVLAYQVFHGRTLLDTLVTFLFFGIYTMMVHTTLGVLFSRSACLFVSPSDIEDKTPQIIHTARKSHIGVYIHLSAGLTALLLFAVKRDHTSALIILNFVWIVATTSSVEHGRGTKTVKWTAIRNVGYITFIWAVILVTIGITLYLDSEKHPKQERKSVPGSDDMYWPWSLLKGPSSWILNLVAAQIGSCVVVAPASLLGLSLRYDLSKVPLAQIKIDQLSLSSNNARSQIKLYKVPNELPKSPKPTYNVGMLALIATLALWTYGAHKMCVKLEGYKLWVLVLFTVPAVFYTSVLSLWKRGQVRQWWNYEEFWGYPTSEEDDLDLEAVEEDVLKVNPVAS